MALTIEQLKFAREIGATHWNATNDFHYKNKNGLTHAFNGRYWNAYNYGLGAIEERPDIIEIDFTPLDDYYADKALDIAATGGEVAAANDPVWKPEADMVNNPPHYQTDGIECIDAIRASLGLDGFVAYCRGNALKYSWRAGKKDDTAQDLRKAEWYLNKAAEAIDNA